MSLFTDDSLARRAEEVRTAVQANSAMTGTAPDGSPMTVLSERKRNPPGD